RAVGFRVGIPLRAALLRRRLAQAVRHGLRGIGVAAWPVRKEHDGASQGWRGARGTWRRFFLHGYRRPAVARVPRVARWRPPAVLEPALYLPLRAISEHLASTGWVEGDCKPGVFIGEIATPTLNMKRRLM